MMKIKPEHYNAMKNAMAATKDQYPQFTPGYYAEHKIGNDTDMRFRWDMWNASRVDNHPAVTWQCGHLYPYLNDSHIDTALRRIVSELYTAA